ncbi:MAG: MotA/TolQ/ExbB proton channel family protein [bacterium]|nr:MotA/TolQ/ExbB proton channel family protein [bacterium]
MELTNILMGFAVGGGGWVLVLLIILSITSIGVIIEKAILYSKFQRETKRLWSEMKFHLEERGLDEAMDILNQTSSPLLPIIKAGLSVIGSGPEAASEAMEAEKIVVKMNIEKRLALLGTLGANAPFIGLFGTVLGIVHSFKGLAVGQQGGVMTGISEALVATAVGLWVAIPAAIFFNFFKKRSNDLMAYADAISHLILKRYFRGEKGKPQVIKRYKVS